MSVDSAMVYRGMDIGTDKPTQEDRRRVRHHMVDVLEPSEDLSVARFQRLARTAVDSILDSGGLPLLVGGSGLYFRAVVDPLEFPGTDPEIRHRWERSAEEGGAEKLYEHLRRVDPAAADRIEPGNVRRIVRALEVIEVTGRRFSAFRSSWDQWKPVYDMRVVGLTMSRPLIDQRIDARVERMVEAGWLEEVRRLEEGGAWSSTSAQTLGYAQMREHLRGRLTLDEAVEVTKRQTRRFARRQLRWFKADPRVRWFDSNPVAASEYLRKAGDLVVH